MKKIILNESYIRQIIKETLENLILGEEDIDNNLSTQEIIDIIKNSNLEYIEEIDVKQNKGFITLYLKNEQYDDIFLCIHFEIDAYITPYYSGNGYDSPPEGGDLKLDNVTPFKVIVNLSDEYETELDMNVCFEYINNILDQYYDDIYEEIDGSYLEDMYYDPDEKYDFWKNEF